MRFFQNAKPLHVLLLQCCLMVRMFRASQVVVLQSDNNKGSYDIKLSHALAVHDKLLVEKYQKGGPTLTYLLSMFTPTHKPAIDELRDLIVDFNDQTRKYSHHVEQMCTSLMEIANDHDLFDSTYDEDMGSTVSVFWDYVLPSKQDSAFKQKQGLKQKMFQRAKFYCAYGYNLQLLFNETDHTLHVIGDKEHYGWMTEAIDKLLIQSDSHTNELLLSTAQRLVILKKVTEKFSDVVRYSAYAKLEKIVHVPSPHTMTNLKHYLQTELEDIGQLVGKLNQVFPLQLEQLLHQQAIAKANADLNRILQDIVEERTDETSQLNQREAERKTSELVSTWNATKTVLNGWKDVVISSTEFGMGSMKEMMGTFLSEMMHNFVFAPVMHVIKTILGWIPFGWLILVVLAIMLGSYILLPLSIVIRCIRTPFVYVLQILNRWNKK